MYRVIQLIVPVIILSTALSTNAASQAPAEEWSPTVNGVQGRLIFVEEPTVNGPRFMGLDLELRNVSDVGNPLEIYYDPIRAFRCEMLDAANRPVGQPPYVADILTPSPYWISLPYQGSLRFRVSVYGYGVGEDAGRMIQMSCGVWLIKADQGGQFSFKASFLTEPPRKSDRRAWIGSLDLPPVVVPQ